MPQQMEGCAAGFYYSFIFEISSGDEAALPLQQVQHNLDHVTGLQSFVIKQ